MGYDQMFYGALPLIFERADVLRKNPTFEEGILWEILKAKKLGVKFRRQHPIWNYIADFYCHELKFVIEVDGSIHDLKEVKENDIYRQEIIESFGIRVIRFTNRQIRQNIIEVEAQIKKYMEELKAENTSIKSRIVQALASPPRGGFRGHLNIYTTAGFPRLSDTLRLMQALQQNGADLIELGMPYSDPLADGPVIQESSSVAIANGMTLSVLFEQLKDMRTTVQVPVILMGYMNPVLQYGFERFCANAAAVGVDGLILPDLPEYEFETEYGAIIKKYGLDFIFLVTPETSEQRLRKLDELSSGFLYAVSSSSTTGGDTQMADISQYLERLQGMNLKNPVLVGFGIKDKATFKAACAHANGAIIGSAFIKAIGGADDVEEATKQFLGKVLG
jgi:tryptophan synthase alpha chain